MININNRLISERNYLNKLGFSKLLNIFFVISVVFTTSLSASAPANFVMNVISHSPSQFKKGLNYSQYADEVDELEYAISLKVRGKILLDSENDPVSSNPLTTRALNSLQSFFNKLSDESFGRNAEESLPLARKHLKVSLLRNRMQSVDPDYNQNFFNRGDNLETDIPHTVLSFLWQPQWIKKVKTTHGYQEEPVSFGEVVGFYQTLKADRPDLAHAFLQRNEHQSLNAIVPYLELRELLLKSPSTQALIKSFRDTTTGPVYISFMDRDTYSFRSRDLGGFSCYQNYLLENQNKPEVHFMTGGYRLPLQGDDSRQPYAALATELDLSTRRTMAKIFPLAPYYPEPNTCVRVLPNQSTLEGSFFTTQTWALGEHHKYESPQEVPRLMKSLINSRFPILTNGGISQAASHSRFISSGDIVTETPARFLQNKKNKKGVKNERTFSGSFSEEHQSFTRLSKQDLRHIRSTSQSHLKSLDWAGSIYNPLTESMREGTINILPNLSSKPIGVSIKNRKDQLLISLFASLHRSYSPVAIALANSPEHCSIINYLYDVMKHYDERTPTSLKITYGQSSSTKVRGNLLRKHVKNYPDLLNVIDCFYTTPQASKVQQAALACGRAEIPVLVKFICFTSVPRTLTFQGHLPSIPLTFRNVKQLIKRLYKITYYNKIDSFVEMSEGSASRIVNKNQRLSNNAKKVWRKFDTNQWGTVYTALNFDRIMLATELNIDANSLQEAQEKGLNFLTTFFNAS